MGRGRPRRRRGRGDPCIYCGSRKQPTADHVPPRCLFPAEVQQSGALIKVPACRQCNRTGAKDAEYFRTMVAIREDVVDHPGVSEILDAALRGLRKPGGRGLRRSLLRGVEEIERISPAGLYLGRAPAYRVDHRRLDRVTKRMVQGLFYHHRGAPMPTGYGAAAFTIAGLPADGPAGKVMGEIVRHVAPTKLHQVGGDLFEYKFAAAADDEHATVWLFRLYGKVVLFGLTLRSEDLGRSGGA